MPSLLRFCCREHTDEQHLAHKIGADSKGCKILREFFKKSPGIPFKKLKPQEEKPVRANCIQT
jgi:hypothetical protein